MIKFKDFLANLQEAKSEEFTHKDAAHVAKQIKRLGKNLRVLDTKDPNEGLYVHHKDDEDGNEYINVKASGGKIHLTHASGATGYDEFHDNIDDAIKAGKAMTGIEH